MEWEGIKKIEKEISNRTWKGFLAIALTMLVGIIIGLLIRII